MTQINANNFAKVTGRLTRDPVFFDNQDGSKTVKITLAYSEEFVRKSEDEAKPRYVDLTGFIPQGKGEGVYNYVTRGSKVGIFYEPYTQSFTRGGKPVYEATNEIKNVVLEESKAETAARRKRNAETEGGTDAAAAATGPVEQASAENADGPFA